MIPGTRYHIIRVSPALFAEGSSIHRSIYRNNQKHQNKVPQSYIQARTEFVKEPSCADVLFVTTDSSTYVVLYFYRAYHAIQVLPMYVLYVYIYYSTVVACGIFNTRT